MTKIKLCGLGRKEDILCANELLPDYIGFVFAKGSRRYVSPDDAGRLRELADSRIKSVGVFVDAPEEEIAALVRDGIIDIVQLHGSEDQKYIERLRDLGAKEIIKAYKITCSRDVEAAKAASADVILLDSGQGGGLVFNWELIGDMKRPYFLAGGLDCENVADAVAALSPYGVDVSSGIETGGIKDPDKMRRFVMTVRSMMLKN